ncbi:porin family protein [Rhodocytophaga aerolata]|uniref:Porin family protein n=1 Tax=Rhodocytophaga aerolata TaxID=455078 RepID=A0ABT8R3Y3_9BACT|nr:porin family protein [Rhodocytophaga aerolata]MDO1446807.1 porin family protein [Rhodocytophaga aerolata]
MKKIALLSLFCLISIAGFSQVKLGLRVAPNISLNSVNSEGIYNDLEKDGSSLRFSAGPIADFFFADNYAFTTGLWYTVKRVGLSGTVPANDDSGAQISAKSLYNIQYLQLPVGLKLFTNEVAPDIRIFFTLGGTLDLKLAEKQKDEANNFLYREARNSDRKAFKPVDAGILFGAGAELVMGANTVLFGGLNYNRGLVNSLGRVEYPSGSRIVDDVRLTNSYFSLEVGLKF